MGKLCAHNEIILIMKLESEMGSVGEKQEMQKELKQALYMHNK